MSNLNLLWKNCLIICQSQIKKFKSWDQYVWHMFYNFFLILKFIIPFSYFFQPKKCFCRIILIPFGLNNSFILTDMIVFIFLTQYLGCSFVSLITVVILDIVSVLFFKCFINTFTTVSFVVKHSQSFPCYFIKIRGIFFCSFSYILM